MRLYNTLARQVEEFAPINEEIVSLYTCGPTVYDYAQLGNLRSFVFEDTLRRALQVNGYLVKHVMNITDVGHLVSDEDEGEDKLQKGAQREGKTVWDVAKYYTEAFISDAKKLNILPPNGYEGGTDPYARATDFIDEQINIIKILKEKEFAYETQQAIYFDTRKLPSYGELTGQKLSEKETGARDEVITDKDKRHPQDFGLWFFAKGRFQHHDMRWPSSWGEGFPGWHLECSAIIHATLGDPIDIHTGGVDHIGTHHTNEMAQTEAAFGHRLANYWVHNEFLLVDNQRMGKSLGNFYTLSDVEKKGYSPLALRLLFLQAHYRSQMNFTWEALDGARQFLNRLQAWADLKFQLAAHLHDNGNDYSDLISQMKQSLSNDLNTAEALAAISKQLNSSEEKGVNPGSFQHLLDVLDDLLGLDLGNRPDISQTAKQMLEQRRQARESNDWPESDRLRGQLAGAGIDVLDTNRGQIWRRAGN
jgi:cysteinyl-tRNA synthetase